MRPMVCGMINAAAAPCTARAPISRPAAGAAAQTSEASTKPATPTLNTFARPKMSPSRPPVIRRTANGSV